MSAAPNEAAARAEIEQRDQVIAGLRARAAAAGFVMHVVYTTSGKGCAFLIARWGRTYECASVEEASAFLDRAGAP